MNIQSYWFYLLAASSFSPITTTINQSVVKHFSDGDEGGLMAARYLLLYCLWLVL